MGRHVLLQGIFPTQGLDQCLMSAALAGSFFTTAPPVNDESPPFIKPTIIMTIDLGTRNEIYAESVWAQYA